MGQYWVETEPVNLQKNAGGLDWNVCQRRLRRRLCLPHCKRSTAKSMDGLRRTGANQDYHWTGTGSPIAPHPNAYQSTWI